MTAGPIFYSRCELMSISIFYFPFRTLFEALDIVNQKVFFMEDYACKQTVNQIKAGSRSPRLFFVTKPVAEVSFLFFYVYIYFFFNLLPGLFSACLCKHL